jgi:hypothetical protein
MINDSGIVRRRFLRGVTISKPSYESATLSAKLIVSLPPFHCNVHHLSLISN